MKFKIDTREKFSVITPNLEILYVNITEELINALTTCRESESKNVILNLKHVNEIETSAAESIVKLQQEFYENNTSFVICEMKKSVEDKFNEMGLLDLINCTPTESEAYDIVQMEEIERELFDTDDVELNQ